MTILHASSQATIRESALSKNFSRSYFYQNVKSDSLNSCAGKDQVTGSLNHLRESMGTPSAQFSHWYPLLMIANVIESDWVMNSSHSTRSTVPFPGSIGSLWQATAPGRDEGRILLSSPITCRGKGRKGRARCARVMERIRVRHS